jgi:hypothetical protein
VVAAAADIVGGAVDVVAVVGAVAVGADVVGVEAVSVALLC